MFICLLDFLFGFCMFFFIHTVYAFLQILWKTLHIQITFSTDFVYLNKKNLNKNKSSLGIPETSIFQIVVAIWRQNVCLISKISVEGFKTKPQFFPSFAKYLDNCIRFPNNWKIIRLSNFFVFFKDIWIDKEFKFSRKLNVSWK